MKIRPLGSEFHAERRTDRHDEANSRLSQFCEVLRKRLITRRRTCPRASLCVPQIQPRSAWY